MLKEYPHENLGPLYRPETVFLPRTSFEPYGPFPGAANEFDRRLCSTLPLYGAQRVIVHEGVLHPLCLELLERGGMRPFPENQCLLYRDRQGFEEILGRMRPRSLIIDHPHPVCALDPAKYMVDRDLLVRMVDKAYLQEWVSGDLLPPRQVLEQDSLMEHDAGLWSRGAGCLLKSTGPYPTGGSYGVVVVSAPAELAAARERLSGPDPLVLEAAIPHRASYCVNLLFPDPPGSGWFLLGAAEQMFNGKKEFAGSWLPPPETIPSEILAAAASSAAAIQASGYVGVIGLDILDSVEGPKVVDLNPRNNFSTAPLFHAKSLRKRLGRDLSFQAFTATVARPRLAEALACLRAEWARDRLLVFRAFFDENADQTPVLCLAVLLPARTAEEADALRGEMNRHGLETSA